MKRSLISGYHRPIFGALLILLATAQIALAHERRLVGPYQFTVGFATEPAYEGQQNGVSLRVQRGEGDDAVPVEGLAETLQVEVTHVPSGISEVMALRSVFGNPGSYTNDWIPTAPGQYRFRFFGTVDELAVDELFESGPDTFNSVEPAETLYFPEPIPAARELEGAVRGAQTAADEALGLALGAGEQVDSIRTLAIVAIVLAAAAILVGAATLFRARGR